MWEDCEISGRPGETRVQARSCECNRQSDSLQSHDFLSFHSALKVMCQIDSLQTFAFVLAIVNMCRPMQALQFSWAFASCICIYIHMDVMILFFGLQLHCQIRRGIMTDRPLRPVLAAYGGKKPPFPPAPLPPPPS